MVDSACDCAVQGLPEIAREAADKLDISVVIQQNANDFIITRKTQIFTETKALKFGVDVVERSNTVCHAD